MTLLHFNRGRTKRLRTEVDELRRIFSLVMPDRIAGFTFADFLRFRL